MRKNTFCIVVGILALSVFFWSEVFAQVLPDIPVLDTGLELERQDGLSTLALDQARYQFEHEYEPAIIGFAASLPSEMSQKVLDLLAEIEANLDALKKIDIYFTDKTYEEVHDAYADPTNVPGLILDDVSTQEFELFLKQKKGQAEDAADQEIIPPHPIPDPTLIRLQQLNESGDLKATRGKLDRPDWKSRISILSVYIHPQTYQLFEQTTVVISTFDRP